MENEKEISVSRARSEAEPGSPALTGPNAQAQAAGQMPAIPRADIQSHLDWFSAQLTAFAELEQGWDEDDAQPPSREVIDAARIVFGRMIAASRHGQFVRPQASACINGSIDLYWSGDIGGLLNVGPVGARGGLVRGAIRIGYYFTNHEAPYGSIKHECGMEDIDTCDFGGMSDYHSPAQPSHGEPCDRDAEGLRPKDRANSEPVAARADEGGIAHTNT